MSGVYSAHSIIVDPVLECVSSAHAAGVITALIKVAADATPVEGTKYPVTCRITVTAGGLTLIDDRTLYLKIKER